ncbi:MAG TPA: hotdog domain-containing protein [Stellaceae bacterium]|jgi:predicted thioesterase|nr:hotdog domain-containing protein [Stellaceae bacterium]
MRTIPIGATGSFTLVVPSGHLSLGLDEAMLRNDLAMPVLVMVIENAALAALRPYLEPGETAVGTGVELRHLAPVGMRVIGEASVTRVEGRRVEFCVSAVDESGQICAGSHERTVVDGASMERVGEAKRSVGRAHLGGIIWARHRFCSRTRGGADAAHVPASAHRRGIGGVERRR